MEVVQFRRRKHATNVGRIGWISQVEMWQRYECWCSVTTARDVPGTCCRTRRFRTVAHVVWILNSIIEDQTVRRESTSFHIIDYIFTIFFQFQ